MEQCTSDFLGASFSSSSTEALATVRFSVQEQGELEALVHKWIESQKARRDLGALAIRDWVRKHWNGYLRARWMEHLEGRRFWIELDHDDFGLLSGPIHASALFMEIVGMLKAGQENLNVILWARATATATDMDAVIEVLEFLDVNRRRIECQFESRLCRSC